MADNKPGPDSVLNEELTFEIRKLYLDGHDYKTIQEMLGISDSSWDRWVWKDYEGFRVFLQKLKFERMIRGAEKVSQTILGLTAFDEEGKPSSDILRIQQKEAEFLRESLGKTDYSKRSELTGKDGEEVNLGLVILPSKNARIDQPEDSLEPAA